MRVIEPIRAVQIAYHVPDPESAAYQYAKMFGWGPFFYLEHIPLTTCSYRGAPATFDHSSAYGQAGDIMIELITQHDDRQSVLRDMYRKEQIGIHHVAHFVPDLAAALDHAQAAHVTVALQARTASGTAFAMLDVTQQTGHMIELYEPAGDLLKFYRYVRRAAEGWDGSEPLRRLQT